MTSGEQVKALVRNKSTALKLDANIILRNVIFEFFLEKLVKSRYANRFIIKGGFLISAITQIDLRTTMDIDVTLKSLSIQKEDLSKYIEEIISIPTHEKLLMKLESIDEIHEDAEYPGLRATISVRYDGIRESIKIDFTTGDIITPTETSFKYKTFLDNKMIELKSYTLETVLAEKMETILSRGILNTRMRDFYDVYLLWFLKEKEIEKDILKQAFINTSTYRKTMDQILPNAKIIVTQIEHDSKMRNRWNSYQSSNSYAKNVEWFQTINAVFCIQKVITN
jgi:predicted nucleotidyltransferase component of viral defense system